MTAIARPDVADLDRVLLSLQSGDNDTRRQAEAHLEGWSADPTLLNVLMTRAHLAPTLGCRQLAATILSWRLPQLWPSLSADEKSCVQVTLLECFSKCSEPLVLRSLGEACNSLCQTVALRQDVLWEDLLRLVAALLSSDSAVHRRAALELLSLLVDSMGARLHAFYPDIGRTLPARVNDTDAEVRMAALDALGALAASWCQSEEDALLWKGATEAALETATAVLAAPSDGGYGPRLLTSALRALARLVPVLPEHLGVASAELACRIVGAKGTPHSLENCVVLALQLLHTLARRSPKCLGEDVLTTVVPTVCHATCDNAPSVDDLDEVSAPALAARDCLRAVVRASPSFALPLVYEAAHSAAESVDAVHRASAVHMVVFALCGVREGQPSWAVPLTRAVGDNAVWVRQAACEGAALLADALRPSAVTTEGLLLLANTLAKQLTMEPDATLVRKTADAVAAIFHELTTDEAALALHVVVDALLHVLPATARIFATMEPGEEVASAAAAMVAIATALGAVANTAADHFAPFAAAATTVLLQLLHAGAAEPSCSIGCPTALTPPAFAACLEAAGGAVASAWSNSSFRTAREELATLAQCALVNDQAASEVRASAHKFFACVALASFEEFSPLLVQVVPPAVSALHAADGSEVGVGVRRRGVRTGAHEERVAAIEALGAYAVAVGHRFAAHMPLVLPAVCSQAQHANAEVRAATARSLGRIGRVLADIVAGLPGDDSDRTAAAGLAQSLTRALCSLISERHTEDAGALRCGLQTKEDLLNCPAFIALVGSEAAALVAAGGGRRSDEVESSEDGDDDEQVGDD